MKVIIEDRPALRLAAVPHVGPYDRISEAFQRLGPIVRPAGLMREGILMLAVYYDDPHTTLAGQLRSDACISVPDGVGLPAGVVEKRLPSGRYARTTHAGAYASLGDTWCRLTREWLPGSGYRRGDAPSFEVYRNTPSDTPADELRTDLYVSIA